MLSSVAVPTVHCRYTWGNQHIYGNGVRQHKLCPNGR